MLFRSSFILAVPISSYFLIQNPNHKNVSSIFRGGIWIYGFSYKDWSFQHEKSLFALNKLVYNLYTSKYNEEALIQYSVLNSFAAASILGHELKHIVQALESRWQKPYAELDEKLQQQLINNGYEWAKQSGSILFKPELYTSAFKLMKLWCQLNNPRDFYEIGRAHV